ncbi:MAG: 1-acyl-sn-glycerol-3-phosphate acyltransferase [Spirochaetales bacterium]|nr:1-acyl-sn-glycerol-3-phosphate acyltransferase [Spirochaetales bacterium]
MIYILYFFVFWIILPLLLYLPAVCFIDPYIGIHTSGSILLQMSKIAPFMLAAGIIIYLYAAEELFKFGHGLPVSAKPPTRLVETGMYFWFRHPLYIGFNIILFSIALWSKSIGFIITSGPFLLALWLIYSVAEEKVLKKRYGNTYRRYAEETGVLFPSMYSLLRLMLLPAFRFFFKLQFINASIIPKQGAFYLISLHRSFFDPLLISAGIDRKIHFLTTSSMYRRTITRLFFTLIQTISIARYKKNIRGIKKTIKILRLGGIVGIFPEGGRSWYGETVYAKSSIELMKKHPYPVVAAEVIDSFSFYPRFSKFPKREKLKVKYTFYEKGSFELERIIGILAQREKTRDSLVRRKKIPTDSRGIEELLFFCPSCGKLFTMHGFKNGTIKCRSCGSPFTLIKGKGVINKNGKMSTLREIEADNIQRLKKIGSITIYISCKYSINFGKYKDGEITIAEEGILITPGTGRRKYPEDVYITFGNMESILIEGSHKLEISYNKGKDYLLVLIPPSKTLFMQYFLRLHAFNSPYKRYKGSERLDISE